MEDKKELRIVDSKVHSLSEIFSASYTVDFYQREYVWQKKQALSLSLSAPEYARQRIHISNKISKRVLQEAYPTDCIGTLRLLTTRILKKSLPLAKVL